MLLRHPRTKQFRVYCWEPLTIGKREWFCNLTLTAPLQACAFVPVATCLSKKCVRTAGFYHILLHICSFPIQYESSQCLSIAIAFHVPPGNEYEDCYFKTYFHVLGRYWFNIMVFPHTPFLLSSDSIFHPYFKILIRCWRVWTLKHFFLFPPSFHWKREKVDSAFDKNIFWWPGTHRIFLPECYVKLNHYPSMVPNETK